jgi:hypothetical protein
MNFIQRLAFRLIVVVLLLATMLSQPSPAYACSCMYFPSDENYARTDAIFIGMPIVEFRFDSIPEIRSALDNLPEKDWGKISNIFFRTYYLVHVYNVWKGSLIGPVVVIDSGVICQGQMSLNKTYLIYADLDPKFNPINSLEIECNGQHTNPLDEATADLEYLESLNR